MTNDTVLLGGLGVLVLGGVIWFAAQRLVDSNLSARAKRLSVYLIIVGFVVIVVMVMRWHAENYICLLYTSPSPRDLRLSRMPSSA